MFPDDCVIAGLDAGNLESVAVEARKRYPSAEIIIAQDFDVIGRAKAKKAAIASHAKLLPPPTDLAPGDTDWWDVAERQSRGGK